MRFRMTILALVSCFTTQAEEPQVSTFITLQATAGMSIAQDGSLYIADFGNINTLAGTSLFKVSPEGDATLITDQLNQGPSGNLIDDDGSILQSIYLSNSIVRVNQDGSITDFAQDVPSPDDLVQDNAGNVFAASCPFNGQNAGVYRI